MACNVDAESMARYLKLTLFASLGFLVSVEVGRRKDRQGLMAQSGGSRHIHHNLVYVSLVPSHYFEACKKSFLGNQVGHFLGRNPHFGCEAFGRSFTLCLEGKGFETVLGPAGTRRGVPDHCAHEMGIDQVFQGMG